MTPNQLAAATVLATLATFGGLSVLTAFEAPVSPVQAAAADAAAVRVSAPKDAAAAHDTAPAQPMASRAVPDTPSVREPAQPPKSEAPSMPPQTELKQPTPKQPEPEPAGGSDAAGSKAEPARHEPVATVEPKAAEAEKPAKAPEASETEQVPASPEPKAAEAVVNQAAPKAVPRPSRAQDAASASDPPAAVTPSGWRAHLASYGTAELAETGRLELARRHAKALGDTALELATVEVKGRRMVRVVAGSFGSAADVRKFCAPVIADRGYCQAVRGN